ncbi:MAG: phospholipase D-like domain-containing protein [Anaerolineae bacterium]|nr:phospholipase D-like domain-containing protein [Thermoflexales bacterium]MDW8408102.1 phospholipase D-like domain-containing protein [Anaerolineae bacterium]
MKRASKPKAESPSQPNRNKSRAAGKSTSSAIGTGQLIALVIGVLLIGFLALRNQLFLSPEPAPTPPATPTSTTSLPGATGIELHVYPEDSEQELLDLIAQAKKRVYMKVYLLTDEQVIDAMKQAMQNGVEVRAMLEENPFGGAGTTKQMFEKLKRAGVNVKYTNPTFRFTHEKSFVIDDLAVIMTANMTKAAFTRNRELLVITRNADDVAEIAAAFEADWNRTEFVPQRPHLVWSPVNSRERINSVINAATRTLEVYAEVAQDTRQIALMTEAVKRGVMVRLITSPSDPPTDAERRGLDALQAGGVKVRYVRSPYIHAKMFVADGTFAFTGSENITATSLDLNRELGILISDQPAIRRMLEAFEKDWSKGVDR